MTTTSFQLQKVKKKKINLTKFPKKSISCKAVMRGGKENEKDESV